MPDDGVLRKQIWDEYSDADAHVRYWLDETAREHRSRRTSAAVNGVVGSGSVVALLAQVPAPWTALATVVVTIVGTWLYGQATSDTPARKQTICAQWLALHARAKTLWTDCELTDVNLKDIRTRLAELVSARAIIEMAEGELGIKPKAIEKATRASDAVLSSPATITALKAKDAS